MILLAAKGKGGLDQKKGGSPGVTPALHTKLLTVYCRRIF